MSGNKERRGENAQGSKSAVAILTTRDDEVLIEQVRHLATFSPVVIMSEKGRKLHFPDEFLHWEFAVDDFQFETISKSVSPGSTVYAAMVFLLQSNFEYLWFIEDDVAMVGGDWAPLIELTDLNYDFIGVDIGPVPLDWFWVGEFQCPPGGGSAGLTPLTTLCGVCGFSRKAAELVISMLRIGFRGHHEMMVPSLVAHHGLTQIDLVRLGFIERGLFRWESELSPQEIARASSGLLIHPVKDGNFFGDVGGLNTVDHVAPVSKDSNRSIRQIFAPIGGMETSCSLEEYHLLASLIGLLAPCRLLVVGVGRDSSKWLRVNEGGETIFLENDEAWKKKIGERLPRARILSVTYPVSFEDWQAQDCAVNEFLLPEIKGDLGEEAFDVVFVDGPWGESFGRHQSIYLASQVVKIGGVIAVHDCQRSREQAAILRLLDRSRFFLLSQIERLQIYKAVTSSPDE